MQVLVLLVLQLVMKRGHTQLLMEAAGKKLMKQQVCLCQ
jgi:hypothetical protein